MYTNLSVHIVFDVVSNRSMWPTCCNERENGLLTRERGWHNCRVHARAYERERKEWECMDEDNYAEKKVLLKYSRRLSPSYSGWIHENARIEQYFCARIVKNITKIIKSLIINIKIYQIHNFRIFTFSNIF